MIYLCCDTNVWINISNSEEPVRLLNILHEEISKGTIKLVVPEIILKEWQRNKIEKIEERIESNIKSQISGLHKLSNFVENESRNIFEEESIRAEMIQVQRLVLELKAKLTKHKATLIDSAKQNINLVEIIFNHPNTIILEADKKSSERVITLAIERKFPFDGKKNNFADCLIFFQYYHYLVKEKVSNAHFVSNNKEDYFPKEMLHEVYRVEFDKVSGKFHKSLSDAMNSSLEKEIVKENELKHIELIAKIREGYKHESKCLVCSEDGEDDASLLRDLKSILFFEGTIEINDQRIEYENPNQLNLFKSDSSLDELEPGLIPNLLLTATCNNCGSEHFMCPECEEVILLYDIDKNKVESCINCEIVFIYREDRGRKGEIENVEFTILKEDTICSRCGNHFLSRGDNSDLCSDCEEFYKRN
ncbi:MAG: DUF4935 domain-containing protein [Bacteroidia bacterium]|nr:DUF4935 domain-containing protein [Bacteroidota bacterium]MBP6412080.1 DUF4935 domain-containing protein [Bacteroidia bacterium]